MIRENIVNNLFQILSSIGSIATFCLFFITLWQYRKISKNDRNRKERMQAKNISAWVVSNEGQEAWLAVSNQSESPVYEAILTLVAFQGTGDSVGIDTGSDFRAFLSVLPPGKYYAKTMGNRGMMFHASAAIAFTDNSGTNWLRDGNGLLQKIDKKPVEYYNLSRPLSWDYPLEKVGGKFI